MLNNPSFQRTLDVHHLYQQIQQLEQENAQLKAQLEQGKHCRPNSLESLDWVQNLTRILPVAISLSRVADGQILYVNTRFISTFGLSAWAIPNYAIPEFYANPTQYQDLINQIHQSGRVENQELNLKRRDGTVFRATVSVQSLSFDPEPAVLTVFHDLSNCQQAEQTLQQQTLSLRRQSLAMRDLSHYNTFNSRDLKVVVRKITETAAHTLNVERVSVWLHPILQQSLLNPDGFTQWLKTAPISTSPWSNILNLKFVCLDRYERQSNDHWIDQQQPMPSSRPFQEAILTQHLIHTTLPIADPLLLDETVEPLDQTQGTSQSLQVPIRLGEEIIGMLWIETDHLTHCWTIEEQTFAEFLANFVALSLEQFERQLTEIALSQVKQQLEVQVEKRTAELKQAVIQLRDEMVERIKTESALERALDAAQAASRVKSTFIATMSHEFRTPLHIILGYADMLYEEATEQQLMDFVPDVQHIRQAGQKLLHLIDNILDLAKIEAGKITLHWETFDLQLVVNELLTQVSTMAEQNQNQLRVDYQTPVALICTDVNKLRQILLNLLDNALKFTHQGQVYLTISQTQRHNKDWICFQVRDTGIGIATDTQQHLFQPFTQLDPSVSRSYGGMGLGLTLSHHFCKLMGGEMTVSSQLGSGSTFAVYLPLNVGNQ
jgi:PAS domain S-box-containing protein